MICSSVKRLLRIVDLLAIDSTISWREFRGAGQSAEPVQPAFVGILGAAVQPKLRRCAAPITTCQREAKAIPSISGTDRAEISATGRGDCGRTRFSGPPFWRMLQPAPRSVSYP
jgi:hypothetical protein